MKTHPGHAEEQKRQHVARIRAGKPAAWWRGPGTRRAAGHLQPAGSLPSAAKPRPGETLGPHHSPAHSAHTVCGAQIQPPQPSLCQVKFLEDRDSSRGPVYQHNTQDRVRHRSPPPLVPMTEGLRSLSEICVRDCCVPGKV